MEDLMFTILTRLLMRNRKFLPYFACILAIVNQYPENILRTYDQLFGSLFYGRAIAERLAGNLLWGLGELQSCEKCGMESDAKRSHNPSEVGESGKQYIMQL